MSSYLERSALAAVALDENKNGAALISGQPRFVFNPQMTQAPSIPGSIWLRRKR